jgi:hypothetical protein
MSIAQTVALRYLILEFATASSAQQKKGRDSK